MRPLLLGWRGERRARRAPRAGPHTAAAFERRLGCRWLGLHIVPSQSPLACSLSLTCTLCGHTVRVPDGSVAVSQQRVRPGSGDSLLTRSKPVYTRSVLSGMWRPATGMEVGPQPTESMPLGQDATADPAAAGAGYTSRQRRWMRCLQSWTTRWALSTHTTLSTLSLI